MGFGLFFLTIFSKNKIIYRPISGAILKWLRGVPAKDLEGLIPASVQIALAPPSEKRESCRKTGLFCLALFCRFSEYAIMIETIG